MDRSLSFELKVKIRSNGAMVKFFQPRMICEAIAIILNERKHVSVS
jgi:hypothetical protein